MMMMSLVLNLPQGTLFNKYSSSLIFCSFTYRNPLWYSKKYRAFPYSKKYRAFPKSQVDLIGKVEVLDNTDKGCTLRYKEKDCNSEENNVFPHVQGLTQFPKDELVGKVVMVRFDSTIFLCKELYQDSLSLVSAGSTIKYLYDCGAKVILLSNWNIKDKSKLLDAEYMAEVLSGVLLLKVTPANFIYPSSLSKIEGKEEYDILLLPNLSQFKQEQANCSDFSKYLSEGVDIYVNDTFSQSHRILASNVGITRCCYACIAGFHFEERVHQIKKITETNRTPYIAIIGGSKLLEKADAIRFLASTCDGLVFVGMMAFVIMQAQGFPVRMNLVERGASEEALRITQIARLRNIPIFCPKDFWCVSNHFSSQMELFPAYNILDGWQPFNIGPKSLEAISTLLSKCKKILWIGPVQFSLLSQETSGAIKLTKMLEHLALKNCEITLVGNMACQALTRVVTSASTPCMVENASVVWEVLKGKKLPGLVALDKAYPLEIDWSSTYTDPTQPLVVDIGSGNGIFLFGMARRRKDLNFLGLEMNEKLVTRCLASLRQSGLKNGYFIATNATSTFRSIVSSYPGNLVLVSIQCPNPDFNKPEYRWSMLQRLLVEAIVDLLVSNGKIFLQSDIEAVAVRMKEQFLQYGKGKTALEGGWLKENPLGVRTDWEQHVIDRGAPMYRLMLYKSIASK